MAAYQFRFDVLDNLTRIVNGFGTAFGAAQRQAQSFANTTNRLGSLNLGGIIGGAVAGIGSTTVALKSLTDAMDMQSATRAIDFASGSSIEGAKNMDFLKGTIEKMGLPMKEAMEGFKVLDASIYGTGLSQQFARDMFQNTAMATTVLGVNADKTQNAFLALGQMASKGVVSMEELRGQLGDALPGAAAIAARAMKMQTPEFNKLVESGKLLAKDFLPKFAAELKNTFEGKLPAAMNSATANFNRFKNSTLDLSIIIGEKLLPPVLSFMHDYLIPSVKWLGQNIDLMAALGSRALFVYGVFAGYSLVVGAAQSIIGALVTGELPLLVQHLATAGKWLFLNSLQWWRNITGALTYSNIVKVATFMQDGMTKAMFLYGTIVSIARNRIAAFSLATFLSGVTNFSFAGILTTVTGALSGLQAVLSFATIKQWLLNAAMYANPIGVVILGIAALGAAFYGLYKLVDNLFPNFFPQVKEVFMKAWDFIYNRFIKPVGDAFKWLFNIDFSGVQLPKLEELAAPTTAQLLAGGGSTNGNKGAVQSQLDSVKGDGNKMTNVYIRIDSLVKDGIHVHTVHLKEGLAEIKEAVTAVLLDATNQLNYSN